ncbi:MAG: pantetheine-phosphate adenylyltransferase [Erysipelotrichales bacterium]|nr:MAG: pantetheine-phosphate adenylyltransferase [Erysipelotrichales bacterium]
MTRAIYPGSFDPITFGHLDVIRRAASLFDALDVVVMHNPNSEATFTIEERLEMLRLVCVKFPNITVHARNGLAVDAARGFGANVLIRGIRAVMDFEYELQQATANMILAPDIETLFLLTKPEYSFLSSSTVKQIALNKGDLTRFVPPEIIASVRHKFDK